MNITEIIVAALSGSTATAFVSWLLLRRKMRAEAGKIGAQADSIHVTSEIKVGEFAKAIADDLRQMLNEQMERSDELQAQVDQLKRENLEWKSKLQRKEIHTGIEIDKLRNDLKKVSDDHKK